MIRQENPRTIGLDLRGEDLDRFRELDAEQRAEGVHRKTPDYGFRRPRVHRHRAPRLGDRRYE